MSKGSGEGGSNGTPTGEPAGSVRGFAFRTDRLRGGDVLLCTDRDSYQSATIRRMTGGKFSHAAICTIPPLVIEANDPGVSEISLFRYSVRDRRNVRILRLWPNVPGAEATATAAAAEALIHRTRPYSTRGAITSILPLGTLDPADGVFCSYLVAEAYMKAGLNVSPGGKTPDKTTPADIEKSLFFEDITADLIAEAVFLPGSEHHFVDADAIWVPVRTEGDGGDTGWSPAQRYDVALREVGKRISAFLVERGQSGASSYPEAQKAFLRAVGQPWFAELDKCATAWMDDLATPLIAPTAKDVAEAVQRESATLPGRLALMDEQSLIKSVALLDADIASRAGLIMHRERSIKDFEEGLTLIPSRLLQVWLEHEVQFCHGLVGVNKARRSHREMHRRYAASQGWRFPEGPS